MKILCDKDEFALLVRECANNSMNVTNGKVCDGCLFCGICDTSIGEHFGIKARSFKKRENCALKLTLSTD